MGDGQEAVDMGDDAPRAIGDELPYMRVLDEAAANLAVERGWQPEDTVQSALALLRGSAPIQIVPVQNEGAGDMPETFEELDGNASNRFQGESETPYGSRWDDYGTMAGQQNTDVPGESVRLAGNWFDDFKPHVMEFFGDKIAEHQGEAIGEKEGKEFCVNGTRPDWRNGCFEKCSPGTGQPFPSAYQEGCQAACVKTVTECQNEKRKGAS